MAKYMEVISDVEGVFATPAWTTNNIQAFPSNYQGGDFAEEFVKIEVIPNRQLTRYSSPGVQGLIIIQIYTRAGQGSRRSFEIADMLDSVLQQLTLPSGTQTGTSSMAFLGIDSEDNSLFRSDYQVTFRKDIT